MKKNIIDFLCCLHGYTIRIKEIHWNTDSNAIHKLCDEIEDDLCGIEDRFAECAMGMEGKKVKIGQLLPVLPNAETLLSMLDELGDDLDAFFKTIDDEKKFHGLHNILDDLAEMIGKYKYRATQK